MADFDDGKEDGALRTIGEVSEALDIKPHVLRYWEQQFTLLKPLKRSGGRRYYREEDVAMVETIDRLVNQEGYTLKGAEAVLRSSGGDGADRRMSDRRSGGKSASDPGAEAISTSTANVDAAIITLKSIRGRLAKALDS
ncbi:MerR family transcriptional regulator [Erythrobacter ani]|uniref:MerR family transcriptional regulator n=1 Tax=Erythrobacter ani TaxID=2827235 RepID=A0ABS6SNM1_9SPHN|nr:MerR family transcriptional regulator [Erythrobacter ani]MBV7266628.1 MerR family transcriptional regulator [Erythrobacter ani]